MKITIPPLDENAMQQARARQDTLLKPKGALGRLETLSIQLAGMTGRLDWLPQRRAVIVVAGDHGVMAHHISTVPQAITRSPACAYCRVSSRPMPRWSRPWRKRR